MHHSAGAQGNFWHIHEVVKVRMTDQDIVTLPDLLLDRMPVNCNPAKKKLILPWAGQKRVNQQNRVSKSKFKPGIAQPAVIKLHVSILTKLKYFNCINLFFDKNKW